MTDDAEYRIRKDMEQMDTQEGITGKPQVPKIKIQLDDKREITVWLYGKKGFMITQGNETIVPHLKIQTQTTWYQSNYYLKMLSKDLRNHFGLTEEKARKIVVDISTQAGKKINEFIKNNQFTFDISEGSVSVLEGIDKVTILRCEDTNTYGIQIGKETIKLTDAQLYDGPYEFCIQYLNRFLQKIVISDEEWDQYFLPYILSKDHYEIVEKIRSNEEIVTEKFIQYVKNKKVFDWRDIVSRTGHVDSVYFDQDYNALRMSPQFIDKFFETNNIQLKYKVTKERFNDTIQKFNVRRRITVKVDGDTKIFRMLDPAVFEITTANIIKTEPTAQLQFTPDLDKFSSEESP